DGNSSEEVEEIGEAYAGGPLDGVYILSATEYRRALQDLAELKATQPEILSRAEYLPAQQLQQGLLLADGSRTDGVSLPDHIKTVVVKGREDRLGADLQSHILLRAPFQLAADTSLEDNIASLLMNRDGSIHATASGDLNGGSVEAFTWRTAFYAQPDSYEQSEQRLDPNEDQIFGPISGATLEQFGWYGTSYGVTDADGRFVVNSPMLCMRSSLGGYLVGGMNWPLTLTVPTVPFNPNRLGIPPYYELRTIHSGCGYYGSYRFDFPIDVLWLAGQLHLANTPGGEPIPVGDAVVYEGQDRSGDPTARTWDYDGDGQPDNAVLADKITKAVTETDPATGEDIEVDYIVPQQSGQGAWQAVYFSSGSQSPDAENPAEQVPDLWRLADQTLNGRPSGLLTGISEDALRHTDLYIFRESTGELLVEVSGLPEGQEGAASRIENDRYLWHTLLRGPKSVRNNFAAYGNYGVAQGGTREDDFRSRSEELGFSSRYQSRDAGLPSPGEQLHIVAINRVTGYVGSRRFTLGSTGQIADQTQNQTPVQSAAQELEEPLELLPPNIQVWAERLTEIEAGLTAGEERQYLIGHEGAATGNDILVGLYTDWRAADGSPLPEQLGRERGADYGLTGRLAKVQGGQLVPVSAGQALDSSVTLEDVLENGSGGQVAEFPVAPGRHLQLLRLPNTETAGANNDHFYL
ncbi:hypothetical protein, partial [Microbulbifer sp.]|uniref:hypothetical protein n=1 Tax=Microbulbifer sp. TaxID=1908541 RepID=UPI003F3831ED